MNTAHVATCGQRFGQQAEQVLNELVFDRRREVQRVQRQTVIQHLANRVDHHRMVMPQRQRAGTRQTIDKTTHISIIPDDC